MDMDTSVVIAGVGRRAGVVEESMEEINGDKEKKKT